MRRVTAIYILFMCLFFVPISTYEIWCEHYAVFFFYKRWKVYPLSPRHGASSGCGWRNGLQVWRVAANILNKRLRTADKGWSSSLGVGWGANNSSLILTLLRSKHNSLVTRLIFRYNLKRSMDWIDLAQDRERRRAFVNAVMNILFP
jgi:hypothetical protein